MRCRPLVLSAVLAVFAACGGGSSGDDKPNNVDASVDAKVFMDAPPSATNALGQLCPFMQGGGGTACPADHACVQLTGVGTNTTTGYCTPDCMATDSICSTGYTGPAGSMQVCALTTMQGSPANGCAIICTDNTQCPTGLSCTMVPMQTVKVCVPT